MPIRVQAGSKIVEFPDGTTEDVMRKALSTLSEPTDPSALDMLTGKVGRNADVPEKEPETWGGGFIRGLRREFVDPLVSSDIAKHAAHPTSAADFAGLALPSAIGMGSAKEFIPAARKLYQGAAQGASEREGLKKIPAMIKGMWGATKRNPDQVIGNFERDLYSKGHVAPNTASIPDRGIPQGEMPRSVASEVEPFKPNTSGYTPGSGSRNTTLKVGGGGPVEVETAQDALARKTGAPSGGVQTDRVPYGVSDAPPAGQTMDQVLQDALEQNLGHAQSPKPGMTTLPDQIATRGMQKPKVGKRPGGYTTDLPAISDTRQQELQQKLGGRQVEVGPPKLDDQMLIDLIKQHGGSETRRAVGISEADVERLVPGPRGRPDVARQRIDNASATAQGAGKLLEHPESIQDTLLRLYESLRLKGSD